VATTFRNLIDSGRLRLDAELFHPKRSGGDVLARITSDGIAVDGKTYPSLSTAAGHISGCATNGWTYWRLRETGRPIAELRREPSQD
jgi:hypothetical protein